MVLLHSGMTMILRTQHRRTGQRGVRDKMRVTISKMTPKFIHIGNDKYHRDTMHIFRRKDFWFSDWDAWLEVDPDAD